MSLGMKASKSKENQFLECWPELKKWFRKGARPLPWRQKPVDPYRVWISEMMSQQSVMKTVIPYFDRWMQTFPTLQDLSKAKEEDVVRAWAGLGYYSRARNILKAAKILQNSSNQGGMDIPKNGWPKNEDTLQKLPGVGPYTAAAVLSIALGRKALPVDGNVLRVGARFFGVPDPLNSLLDRQKIEMKFQVSLKELKHSDSSVFSQSLMELGALVCKPQRQALCELCPLQPGCVAAQKKKTHLWPKPKKRRKVENIFEHMLLGDGGAILEQILEGERLQGQWRMVFESLEEEEYRKKLNKNNYLFTVLHNITHHKYHVAVSWGRPKQSRLKKGQKRLAWNDFDSTELVLTTLTRKILKSLKKSEVLD